MNILLGSTAFLLFFCYDLNNVKWKISWLNNLFFVATGLLVFASVDTFFDPYKLVKANPIQLFFGSAFALVFLILLIYTLFFAIPFKRTYIEEKQKVEVYQEGVYSLCRHPGVLWFIGLYLSLFIFLPTKNTLTFTLLMSILNIGYVVFQDQWTFLYLFSNYEEYKNKVPFLLPTKKSVKDVLIFIRARG